MTDHRVTLDPSILDRLITSIDHIKPAWQADVDDLRAERARSESLVRELNLATDRVSYVQADLAEVRAENTRLQQRNAYLEAQCQRLFDLARNAQDDMAVIADQAVQVARDIPETTREIREDGTTSERQVSMPVAQMRPTGVVHTEQRVRDDNFIRDDGTTAARPASQPAAPPQMRQSARTLQDVHVEREVEEDDGTGLPQERPAFLRTPMPANEFSPRAAGART